VKNNNFALPARKKEETSRLTPTLEKITRREPEKGKKKLAVDPKEKKKICQFLAAAKRTHDGRMGKKKEAPPPPISMPADLKDERGRRVAASIKKRVQDEKKCRHGRRQGQKKTRVGQSAVGTKTRPGCRQQRDQEKTTNREKDRRTKSLATHQHVREHNQYEDKIEPKMPDQRGGRRRMTKEIGKKEW